MNDADDRDDALYQIALRVTDGESVIWDPEIALEPAADPGLESMRLIADIASLHRDRGAAETPALFTWGPLRVLRKLGEGTFGEVYSGWDPALQREVALKLSRDDGEAHALRPVQRLEEARRLARLRHPHVLAVYGVDVHDGRTGIWFDLLHGRTLEEDLRERGPMGAREAAAVGMDLCSALAAVHGAGLVHGDVKTRNVMREGNTAKIQHAGRVVLMDFGSAHEAVLGAASSASPGTPLYAAPEVLRGEPPSSRSDLYSMGVLLFRLMTGRYPFEARSLSELTEKIRRSEGSSLRTLRPDLPAAFVNVVERALSPDPAQRFADPGAMERALLQVLAGYDDGERRRELWRTRWKRARPWVGALAGLSVAAAGIWLGARWAWPHIHPAPRTAAIASSPRLEMRGGVRASLGIAAAAIGGASNPRLVVGACLEDRGRGRAYLLEGGAAADAVPTLVFEGERPGDRFGSPAVALGDVNGDWYADLGIGAPGSEAGGRDAGRVYVYFGGSRLDARADWVLTGLRPLQRFGGSLAGIGDVNGDGFDDVLVGAQFDDRGGEESGRAYVYFGGAAPDSLPDLELAPEAPKISFSSVVVGIGDSNADGYPDFAIGAALANTSEPSAGRVYLYFGGPDLDQHPDLVLDGRVEGELFGARAAASDLNGDGHPDLIVGAPRGHGLQERSGNAYIYFGGPELDTAADLVLRGKSTGSEFGIQVAGIGDINQDGFEDVVIGALHEDQSVPATVFFGGRKMDAEGDLELTGNSASLEVRPDCGSAGDFFLDGFPDLFLGCPSSSSTVEGGGALLIFDIARFVVTRPHPGEIVAPGSRIALGWLGAEPADISVSVDRGANWSRVAVAAGGEDQNSQWIDVPGAAADSVLFRLEPSSRSVRGRVTAFFPAQRP